MADRDQITRLGLVRRFRRLARPRELGAGLLMRRGYTIVWSGWDSEAPRAGNGMAMTPLIATDNGKPIVRGERGTPPPAIN